MRSRQWFRGRHAALIAAAAVWLAGAASCTDASLEARVAAIEAREEIRGLIHAYGRALDHRDFVAFAALFEPEAGTWVGGFGEAIGQDAIFGLMDERIGHATQPLEPTSHHVLTNIEIDVNGSEATATTKWIFVVPSTDGAPQWRFLGHYDDRFVQRDGRWYFLRREAFTDIPPP